MGSRHMRRSVPEAGTRNQQLGKCCGRTLDLTWTVAKNRKQAGSLNDLAAERIPPKFFCYRQNCVDTAFLLPQYLVLRMLPVPQVGWRLAIGTLWNVLCKGKSFTEDPSWQRRRKQKKRRNTNRLRND